MANSRHHILFDRHSWCSRQEARYLRGQPLLIPHIDEYIHTELHNNCPIVPLLGYHALIKVASCFEKGSNTLQTLDKLLCCIDDVAGHYKTHYIERDLADLTIESIKLQIPYLKDSQVNVRVA